MRDQSETSSLPRVGHGAKPQRSRHYLIAALVVAVAVTAGLIWYMQTNSSTTNPQPAANTTPTAPAATKPADDPLLQKFLAPTTGETWFSEPKTIAAQGYFKKEYPDFYPEGDAAKNAETMRRATPEYTEVGKRGDNTIILAISDEGIGGPLGLLFEKAPSGEVSYIARPQTTDKEITPENRQYYNEVFASKVTSKNETIHYDSLSVPGWLVLDNGEKLTRPEWSGTGTKGLISQTNATKIKVADYGHNKLYRIETYYKDTDLTNVGYYLESVLGLEIFLDYTPNTISTEKYTWNNQVEAKGMGYDGKVVFDDLRAIARGCGSYSAAVTKANGVKASDLQPAGKTDAGRTVYQFKDNNSQLVKKAYDEYAQWQKTMEKPAILLEEFVKQHGLVVIKNASGDLLAYVRQQLAPSYGCAKPVVYLYPETSMSVDVGVGADVKLSDPYYPAGGWRNVWAEPSGNLTYHGLPYESLFWEGPGYGMYPGITSGTVVKQADAERTIRLQLAQQGLSAKETADFMAFWTDKIPNKPYIRLTWLTLSEINQLAPLYVSPRPDTVQRVFLDMAGYDQPVSLPRQVLRGFERRGFTVVEWGGLTQMR